MDHVERADPAALFSLAMLPCLHMRQAWVAVARAGGAPAVLLHLKGCQHPQSGEIMMCIVFGLFPTAGVQVEGHSKAAIVEESRGFYGYAGCRVVAMVLSDVEV